MELGPGWRGPCPADCGINARLPFPQEDADSSDDSLAVVFLVRCTLTPQFTMEHAFVDYLGAI